MKIAAIFENGAVQLTITPENEFEKRLIGAVTTGEPHVIADVVTDYEGHHSNQRVSKMIVNIQPQTGNAT